MSCAKLFQCGILAAIFACATLTGCDKTVVEKTKTTDGPNGSTVEKEKVVQHPDGSITKEKESSTTKP